MNYGKFRIFTFAGSKDKSYEDAGYKLMPFGCVPVCCSVLYCVAVCCSVLQCAAVCCIVLKCVAVCCSVFQCVANKG